MTDHFERGDLLSGLPPGPAVPALRPAGRRAGRRAPPAVVGVRRAGPAPRPAGVRQRPPRRRAGRPRRRRRGRSPSRSWAAPGGRGPRSAPRRTASATTRWRRAGWCRTRLPQLLDLAPAELVAQLAARRPARPAATDVRSCWSTGARRSSTTRCTARSSAAAGRRCPTLLVHPDDAAARGLATGDIAVGQHGRRRVPRRRRGHRRDPAGVVSLPHGFDEANVNHLIPTTDADPLSGMTIVSGLPVDVQASIPIGQRGAMTRRIRHRAITKEGGRMSQASSDSIVRRRARVHARNSRRRSRLHRGLHRDGCADPRGS